MSLDEAAFTQGGLSRRRLLQLAARGLPALAGLGRFTPPVWAQAATPIVKPLPRRPPLLPRAPARATDQAHRTQPAAVPFNDAGYLFEAIVKHPVQAVRV